MKTLIPKPLSLVCVFFIGTACLLFHKTTLAQNTEQLRKPDTVTEDGARRYLVKQIDKIIDGDTFDATLFCTDMALCTNIRIRIMSINCPELRASCEEEKKKALMAREVLRSLLDKADRIEVLLYPKDKYDRYLGDIYLDSQNLADILIEKGLAKPYYGKGKAPDWCE